VEAKSKKANVIAASICLVLAAVGVHIAVTDRHGPFLGVGFSIVFGIIAIVFALSALGVIGISKRR
jgi:hypothetical protein